jgi:nucleotide-binding universal stress UspA family protein
MLPIRTILHPTDFSPQAETAFALACALARDYDARLIVAHVWEPPPVMYADGYMPIPAPDTRETFRLRLENLRPVDPPVEFERRFLDGSPVREILREARETNADLIVMGTHGWSGLSRLFMGSVAEGVMRKAPCPVMTVKTPMQEETEATPVPTVAATVETVKA